MQEEKLTFQEKILKHRLTRIYRILLLIILIVAIFVVVRIQIENKVYTDYEVVNSAESIGSSDSVIMAYNGNILCYSRDGISAYNSKGDQLWNQTYEMQSPVVCAAGEYVTAGDYKGNTIYVMNGAGPCGQISTNMVLLDVAVSEKGIVTAVLDDDTVTWLNVYTSEGENVVSFKTSMNQTGFPLKTSMSSDNRKMAVSYLKAGGNGINTSIAFYNFGDVGQNVMNKVVSGFDYDNMVIPFLHFVNENDVVAVGENKLLIFGGKEIPELKAEADIEENVEGIFWGDSCTALVYRNDDGEDKYRLDVYDLSAKLILSQTFDMEYSNIILNNGNIIIYNEASVCIWNKKGLEKYNGDLGGSIKAVIPTKSKTKYIVVRNEGLEIVKLK
ncbi:MAG: hypothetical protein J6K58_15815 [Lachnospiraceae bacterium]|nr:hypothetical protein [Lachnospiraceae bacterium]